MSFRVSEIRSTISRLRSSLSAADLDEAELKLLSVVEDIECTMLNLRDERDLFESELSGSRLEAMKLKVELAKFERECDINDGKLSDMERDLSLAREKEASANKRYGKMCEEVRVIEGEKEELLEELQRNQSLYSEKMTILNDELADLRKILRVKEVENDDLLAKNGRLKERIEEVKRESDAHLEGIRRIDGEKEEIIKELRANNLCLEEKIEKLKEIKRSEKEKHDANLEELRRIDGKKEEKIKELEKKIGIMEMKTMEFLKNNEGLEEIEKQVMQLERCVADWVSNVPREKGLGNADVKKIMSFAVKVADSRTIWGTNVIEIESGSDNDNDNDNDNDDDDLDLDLGLHELRKRSLKRMKGDDGSSEKSSNPKNRVKKLSDLGHERTLLEHSSSISTLAGVRKCNEKANQTNTTRC